MEVHGPFRLATGVAEVQEEDEVMVVETTDLIVMVYQESLKSADTSPPISTTAGPIVMVLLEITPILVVPSN